MLGLTDTEKPAPALHRRRRKWLSESKARGLEQAGDHPTRWGSLALPVLVAVLPALVLLIVEGSHLRTHSVPIQDFAYLVRDTRAALHGQAQLGAWSRFGFQHPGPALFYWWAPFFWLSGQQIAGLAVGMVVLNGILIGGVVAVAGRVAGLWAAWGACLVLVVFNLSYGADRLPEIWNPNTTIYPLIACAVFGAAFVAKRRWALPVVAGLASFTIQGHFGTTPLVAVVVMVLLGLAAWTWRSELRRLVMPAVATCFVLLGMWALPIDEQLTHNPGNFGRLVQYVLHAKDTSHTWSQVRTPVVSMLSLRVPHTSGELAGWGLPAPPPGVFDYALVMLLFGGCAAGVVLAAKWRRPYELALCAAGLAGVPACFLVANRVSGDIFFYVVVFCYSIAVVGWMGIVGTVAQALRRLPAKSRARPITMGVMTVALAVVLVGTLSLASSDAHATPTAVRRNDPAAARFTNDALGYLAATGGRRKLFVESDAANNLQDVSRAIGVVVQLQQHGYPIGMDWWFASGFGRGIVADGHEVTRVSLVASGHPPPGLGPADKLVARHDQMDLYIGPMPPHGPSVPPPGVQL